MSSTFIASSVDVGGSSGSVIELTKPDHTSLFIPVGRGFVMTRIAAPGLAYFVKNNRYDATQTVANTLAVQLEASQLFAITTNLQGQTIYTYNVE